MYISCILAKELAENSQVQDAFVIAVEQQAKERLERLSALRRIKPVDMTKLSQQVNTKVTKVVNDAERNKSAFLCTSHLLTFLHSSMNVFFISCLKGDHISVERSMRSRYEGANGI